MRIAITTKDEAYAAARATDAEGRTVVEIPAAQVERLTFAGQAMIRFDLTIAGKLPRDWGNRYTMYPATRIVR